MTNRGPILTDPRYLELRDRFAGLLVFLGSMAFCLGLSFWAKEAARPEAQPGDPPQPTLHGIVGWPHAVDAIATLPAARSKSRPHELRQIVLEGVKSDGTIDLVTGPGSLTYVFHNAARKPKPTKPTEKVTVDRQAQCPRQVIRVRRDGIDPQSELKDNRCAGTASEPLPMPTCGPRELWARAIAKGASIRQLAHIEYYRSKDGPAWRMALPSDRSTWVVSGDCQRELEPLQSKPISN
jgi:hypothetical protein